MITSIPNWQSMTAVEILAYLDVTIIARKHADAMQAETAWATGARGLRDFGPVVWEQMVGTIRAMGLNETANQIVSGMDYGDPATLSMIDQLATSNPEVFTVERVGVLRSWGLATRKRYWQFGYGELPSIDAIEDELNKSLARVRQSAVQAAIKHALKLAEDRVEDPMALPTLESLLETVSVALTANWPEA